MNPDRWRVRSLRRFKETEILVYAYLGVGSLLSAIYFVAAVVHSQFYALLFNVQLWGEHALLGKIFLNILLLSILRSVLWLPQLFWQVIVDGVPFLDWLLAVNILQGFQ